MERGVLTGLGGACSSLGCDSCGLNAVSASLDLGLYISLFTCGSPPVTSKYGQVGGNGIKNGFKNCKHKNIQHSSCDIEYSKCTGRPVVLI